MTRVTRFKIGYVLAFLVLAGAAIAITQAVGSKPWVVATIIVVLLIPGRLQGILFRELFRGRRALDHGNPQSALEHLTAFLETIRSQPWRKPALWLSWSLYTPSVEAMTYNNIGSAYFALGDLDAAEQAWRAALASDPHYSIPYANLALVAASRHDPAESARLLDTAKTLGYSGAAFDRFVRRTQGILAAVES